LTAKFLRKHHLYAVQEPIFKCHIDNILLYLYLHFRENKTGNELITSAKIFKPKKTGSRKPILKNSLTYTEHKL